MEEKQGKKPDFTVVSSTKLSGRDGKEGKTYWTRLGVAFVNKNSAGEITSISLRLNAYPKEGDPVLFPWNAWDSEAQVPKAA